MSEADDLIDAIRRVAAELGESSVARDEFRRRSGVSERKIESLFGSYNKLVEAAGLNPRLFPATDAPTYSEEDLLNEVLRVLRLPGSEFTRAFFGRHAAISASVCERRLGGWGGTLKAANELLDYKNDAKDAELSKRLGTHLAHTAKALAGKDRRAGSSQRLASHAVHSTRSRGKTTAAPADQRGQAPVTARFQLTDLHPRILSACRMLFQDAYYEQAVFDACRALQEFVRYKTGRNDLDGADLMAKVLADEGPMLEVRDLGTETGRNVQAGYRFLAMGVMRAFRNPSAHEFQGISQTEAFEMIAAVSLIARAVDRARVHDVPTRLPANDRTTRSGVQSSSAPAAPIRSLEIFYARKSPMWWPEERWHRIGIRNTVQTPAHNVELWLESIEPVNPLDFNVLPSRLGRKGGGADDCRINPGRPEYFDLIQEVPRVVESGLAIITSRGPRTLALWTVEAAGQHFELDSEMDYVWTVAASASNSAPDTRQLLVRHRQGGGVEIELLPRESTAQGG